MVPDIGEDILYYDFLNSGTTPQVIYMFLMCRNIRTYTVLYKDIKEEVKYYTYYREETQI